VRKISLLWFLSCIGLSWLIAEGVNEMMFRISMLIFISMLLSYVTGFEDGIKHKLKEDKQ